MDGGRRGHAAAPSGCVRSRSSRWPWPVVGCAQHAAARRARRRSRRPRPRREPVVAADPRPRPSSSAGRHRDARPRAAGAAVPRARSCPPPEPNVSVRIGDGAPVPATMGSSTTQTCTTTGVADVGELDYPAPLVGDAGDDLTFAVDGGWHIRWIQEFDRDKREESGDTTRAGPVADGPAEVTDPRSRAHRQHDRRHDDVGRQRRRPDRRPAEPVDLGAASRTDARLAATRPVSRSGRAASAGSSRRSGRSPPPGPRPGSGTRGG